MGGRLRRGARSACLAAAGAALLLAATTSPSPAQEEPAPSARPDVFRAAASAQVASVQVDRDALLPIDDLFRFIALDGSATYESSTRQARASLLFPGNGLIVGPSLLCGTFGGSFPAEMKPILDTCLQYRYPLTVFADDFEPDGVSSGALALGTPGDPVSGKAVRAAAHAGEDAATTDAALQDLRVLGLPALGPLTPLLAGLGADATLLSVDSAASRTDQRIDGAGALVLDAEATVSGVRLLGGLVRIGSLVSRSSVTDDGAGERTAESSLEVTGVTVGGIPAQLTEDGLVLGTPSGGLGPLLEQLQTQLQELLRALDVTIAVLPAEQVTDGPDGAVASAGGLLVELAVPVDGLPTVPGPLGDLDPNGRYSASIQLGATAVRGAASTFGPDPAPTHPGPIGGGVDLGPAPFDPGPPLDLSLPDVGGPVAAPPAVDRPAPAAPRLTRIVDLFGGRLELVYAAVALAALGLCVAPRFTPARLPGPAS